MMATTTTAGGVVNLADSEDDFEAGSHEFTTMNSIDDEEEDDDEEEEEEEEEEDDDDEDEDEEGATQVNNSALIHATPTLASLSDPSISSTIREIGHDAVWSLSTAKPGNGVIQIRDNSIDTYWQSDGGQPHLINIHFLKRKSVSEIAFYLDYTQDESYTPKKISIRSGITFHELEEIKVVEMNEPVGWVSVPLYAQVDPLEEDDEDTDENDADGDTNMDGNKHEKKKRRKPLRTYLLQCCIVSMHQNGRDLHCRQVKVFGPRSETEATMRKRDDRYIGNPHFQTVGMSQFSVIR